MTPKGVDGMPLVAHLDGERIDATLVPRHVWLALQQSPERARLILPSCRVRGVAKTSPLGLQFFAHYELGDCTAAHRAETPEHRTLKAAVADLLRQHGWDATVEHEGPGGAWIADVLARSPEGRTIAFEVQLSAQRAADYARRTARYRDAGIETVWITQDRSAPHERGHRTLLLLGPVPADPTAALMMTVAQRFLAGRWKLGAAILQVLNPDPEARAVPYTRPVRPNFKAQAQAQAAPPARRDEPWHAVTQADADAVLARKAELVGEWRQSTSEKDALEASDQYAWVQGRYVCRACGRPVEGMREGRHRGGDCVR